MSRDQGTSPTGRAPPASAADARPLALVVGVKAAVGMAVLASGFVAVSDDDFARVVLAQRWAASPALDPTGTSWLPLPFWVNGGVMLLGGRSLAMARVTAFVLGLGAAALLYAAARLLVEARRAACGGALLAAVLPWSARLGVATVPELPAAALSVFAVATLARPSGRLRALGGAALLAACLSRYEPWIVAAGFCAYTAIDLWRARGGADRGAAAATGAGAGAAPFGCATGGAVPWGQATALLLAAAGPALWMAYNRVAHGAALAFAARVSAYARALGAGALGSLWGYPLALLREEPELCALAVLLLGAAWWWARPGAPLRAGESSSPPEIDRQHRSLRRMLPASLGRTAVVLLGAVAVLSLAALPGGAPTHHVGRALLASWLAMAIYVGAGLWWALGRAGLTRWLALAALAVLLPLGALVLRPWYARLDAFTPRAAERALGAAAARRVPTGQRVLLEVRDWGFFAVQAASGRPEMWVLDRSIDPRRPAVASSFAAAASLRARARQASVIFAAGLDRAPLRATGPSLAARGPWLLVRLGAAGLTPPGSAAPRRR